MDTLALGTTGRQTTRLGFGCSSLMNAMDRPESLAMLETAYDAGIRHFDVAPMYGYGDAESCLGEFLQRHRDHVTVTTKYGIPPAHNRSLIKFARKALIRVIKIVPGVKKRLARIANLATGKNAKASFTPNEAEKSLHRSLTALRTDCIDVWLLHEVEADDLQDDGLLHFLVEQVRKGKIGTFGIGSEGTKVRDLVARRPKYCRTLQYEWSVLNDPIPPSHAFRIHHRALTTDFRLLHQALTQRHELCSRWSSILGQDISRPVILAELMLKAALVMNPASIILFSSKNSKHIRANAEAAANITIEPAARQLYRLLQAERGQILPPSGLKVA